MHGDSTAHSICQIPCMSACLGLSDQAFIKLNLLITFSSPVEVAPNQNRQILSAEKIGALF